MTSGVQIEICAHKICKSYGKTNVINNVSFTLKSGSVTGFLGANGAGKTTILRILSNLLTKDSGKISIGYSEDSQLNNREIKIGVILDKPAFVPYLTGKENLIGAGNLITSNQDIETLATQALKTANLTDVCNNKVHTYSTGMTKRLAIAFAILHNPDILLLDEPFEGLDPESRFILRSIIRKFANEGKTIFVSSHQLSEIEPLCSDILFLRKGEVVFQGKISNVSSGIEREITFITSLDRNIVTDLDENIVTDKDKLARQCKNVIQSNFPDLLKSLKTLPTGFSVKASDESIPEIVTKLISNDVSIFAIKPEKQSLEQLFINLKDQKLPDKLSLTYESSDRFNPEYISSNQIELASACKYELIKLFKSPGKIALLFLPSILPLLLLPLLLMSPWIFAGFRAKYILPAVSGSLTLALSFSRYIYPLLCAIVAADTFATESNRGIVDTALITGISRFKLFTAKILALLTWLLTSLALFPLIYLINMILAWFFIDESWWNAYNLPLSSISTSFLYLLLFFFLGQAAILGYWVLFSVSSSSFGKAIIKGLVPLTILATLGSLSNEICALLAFKTNPALSFFTTQYAKIGDFDLLDSVFNHGITAWPPYFMKDMFLLTLEGFIFCILAALIFARRDFNGGKE